MFDIDATWNSDSTQDLLNNGLFGQIKVNGKILENKKKRKLKDARENTEGKKKKKKKIKNTEFELKNDIISTDQILEKIETSDVVKKEIPAATNINKEQRKTKKKSKTVATVIQAGLNVKDTQLPVLSETQSVSYVKDTKSLIEPVAGKEILTDSILSNENAAVNEVCATSKKVKTKKVKNKGKSNKNKDEKNLTIKSFDINSQKGLNTADKSSDNVDFDLSVTRTESDLTKKVENILKEEEDKKARILLLKTNQNKSSKDKNTKYNKFQEKLSRKLEGGQFRWINEQLYTTKSYEAFKMFREAPQLFRIYHQGFESQVKYWPENPVDMIINDIKESDEENSDIVADFGCGDAKISQSLSNKVHSFDLVAVNSFVTACDMRNVPLDNGSVDIAVFCLSLMGTNVVDFITEAGRVLKQNGLLKIAEVKSRFDDMKKFIKNIESLGFQLIYQNEKNKMFVLLDFVKVGHPSYNQIAKVQISMNPCIYKRR